MAINPDAVYYNYGGKLPPITLEATAVEPPPGGEIKLITDTTLRDGAQDSRFALFPVEARLKYVELLNRLDNGTGRIDRMEMFIYQERDVWTLHQLFARGYLHPEITTWTRAAPKDIKLLMEVSKGKVKETGMLASASDHHIFDKLRFASKQEAAEKYLQPVVTAYENGIRPRLHLEDATRADIFGWVLPFMQMALKATNGTARFRVCDTIGWGSPDPYAALPWGIPRLIDTLKRETGAELEFHGHNDFGLATANTMAAWRYGCTKANVTFAGLGERTGNTSLEQMVAAYIRLYDDPGFDLTALDEMRQLISADVIPTNANAPIIGEVFTTAAGIHQSGVARQEDAQGGLIYLPFAAGLFGRETVELSRIGSLSGADGIVSALNRQVEVETGTRGTFTTTSRVIKLIYDAAQAAYDGTITADEISGERRGFFTAAELLAMARQYDPQLAAAE